MNTQLTDRRIESMRTNVLDAVDTDIKKRGSTLRRRAGFFAAGLVVIAGSSMLYPVLTPSGDGVSSTTASDSVGAIEPGFAAEPRQLDSMPNEDGAGDKSATDDAGADENRDIVTTGHVEVSVNDPRESAQRLAAWVTSIGGRIDSRRESGINGSDDIYASLSLRVPSTKVTETIERLRNDGTVNSVSINNTDITAQTRDLDARIKALKISIDRLETLLSEATTSSAVIQAENALADRQQQLESYESERRYSADQVSLSTLEVNLSPTAKADKVSPGGFRGGITDGWNSLVSTVNKGIEAFGVAVPWIVVGVALYGLWRLVTGRRKAKAE